MFNGYSMPFNRLDFASILQYFCNVKTKERRMTDDETTHGHSTFRLLSETMVTLVFTIKKSINYDRVFSLFDEQSSESWRCA